MSSRLEHIFDFFSLVCEAPISNVFNTTPLRKHAPSKTSFFFFFFSFFGGGGCDCSYTINIQQPIDFSSSFCCGRLGLNHIITNCSFGAIPLGPYIKLIVVVVRGVVWFINVTAVMIYEKRSIMYYMNLNCRIHNYLSHLSTTTQTFAAENSLLHIPRI